MAGKLTKNERAVLQAQQMFDALKRIAKGYQTPDQLRRNAERDFGLEYAEALEYAYENLQQEAARAIRGIRRPAGRAALQEEEKR